MVGKIRLEGRLALQVVRTVIRTVGKPALGDPSGLLDSDALPAFGQGRVEQRVGEPIGAARRTEVVDVLLAQWQVYSSELIKLVKLAAVGIAEANVRDTADQRRRFHTNSIV